MSLDTTTIEVIKGALIYAAEEMGISLKMSAYSPNIKERMDHSCAIFNNLQELVAQAEHIPVHLGSMAMSVQQGLETYKKKLNPGDMLLLNDPYISGTHLPDLTLIAPIFFNSELIGYAANKAHHTDIGGMTPGSMAGDATELYQEGLVIPPVKLMNQGQMDPEISSIIRSNVRTPETQMGDLRAQIAANNTGIKRTQDLAENHGVESLHEAMSAVIKYSEQRIRSYIKEMPEGTYYAKDVMEEVRVGGPEAIIAVKVTVGEDDLSFDYSDTSPQVYGPVNAPLGVTVAGIYYTLISVTDPSIPVNDGCFRPITLKIPEGCLMNPKRPASVSGGNVETSQRNVDVLMKAFSQILPERVPAAGQGTMNNVTIGGLKQDGTPWTFIETIGGGSGGRPTMDGVDGVHVNMTNTMNTPIEALEAYFPLQFISYNLRPDSGGPGKFRGGCGIERSWKLTSPRAILSIMAERTRVPPWGLNGGRHGALGEYWLRRANGKMVKLGSKVTVTIWEGDILIVKTPGGGGYGNPMQRDPKEVLKDILDGLVSIESASKDYGVVINPESNEIDFTATSSLRGFRQINP